MFKFIILFALLAFRGVGATPSLPADTIGLPLVQKNNLVYAGAFRLPNLPYTGNICDGFTYGGRGIAWNPAGNNGQGSIFITGHNYCGYVGEISIPGLINTSNPSSLVRAQLLQVLPSGLADPLEGRLTSSGITGATHTTINGLLVNNGRLIVSVGNDSSTVVQPVSHYSRSINLSTAGVNGPVKVYGNRGYTNPRFLSGYMCHIPASLQSTFGYSAFTGWVPQNIVANSSNGPSLFAFNPGSLEGVSELAADTLLFYPSTDPLQTSVQDYQQSAWNWTSMVRGCAIPQGTGSVMFLGRHGVGKFGYCSASSDPASACYDPSDVSYGEHAWPYVYKVWAYRLSDLLAVKVGTLAPQDVQPYSIWTFNLPNEDVNDAHGIGGITYDPATRRLYVVQESALPGGEPIIHVFTVNNAVVTSVNY
jgi:hypothetical protein